MRVRTLVGTGSSPTHPQARTRTHTRVVDPHDAGAMFVSVRVDADHQPRGGADDPVSLRGPARPAVHARGRAATRRHLPRTARRVSPTCLVPSNG